MATYYISDADGDNSDDGGSDDPYKTIAHALTTRGGSNTYVIHSGNYDVNGEMDYNSIDNVTITTAGDGNVTVSNTSTGGSAEAVFKVGDDWIFTANMDLIIKPSIADLALAIEVGSTSDRVHVTGTAFIGPRNINGYPSTAPAGGSVVGTSGCGGIQGGAVNAKGCYFHLLNIEPIRINDGSSNAFATSSIDSCLIYRCGAGPENTNSNDFTFGISLSTGNNGQIEIKNCTIMECTGSRGIFRVGSAYHTILTNNLVYDNFLSGNSAGGSVCYGINIDNTDSVTRIKGHSNNSYNTNNNSAAPGGGTWTQGGATVSFTNYYAVDEDLVPANNYATAIENFGSVERHQKALTPNLALAYKSFSEDTPNIHYISGYTKNGIARGTIYDGNFIPSKHYPGATDTSYEGGNINHNMGLGQSSVTFTGFTVAEGGSTEHTAVASDTDILGHPRGTTGESICIGCFENLYWFGIPPQPDTNDEVAHDFTIKSYNRRSDEYAKNTNQTNFIPYIKGPINLRGRNTSYYVEKG